jgi:hypothetical protein
MAEVLVPGGGWTFDGDLLRIVLGSVRRADQLRRARGEITVPVVAIAGVTFSPGRRAELRLRLRDGADPFLQVGGGLLSDQFDPYRLAIPASSGGAAEYLVDEIRNTLTIEQVPPGAVDHYLVAGPAVPLSARADDGVASFDGSHVRLEWTRWASPAKTLAGPQLISLDAITGLEWSPMTATRTGFLRFNVRDNAPRPAQEDPACLTWGAMRRNRWGSFVSVKTKAQAMGGTTSMVAAAVAARLPHPYRTSDTAAITEIPPGRQPAVGPDRADHDALLRRLRELGTLRDEGMLTDDEHKAAKQAVLRQFY